MLKFTINPVAAAGTATAGIFDPQTPAVFVNFPRKLMEDLSSKMPTWMSRDGSERINGDRINGLFHLLINGVFLGVK